MSHAKGTLTFVMQRATAVVLIPFVAWAMISLVAKAGAGASEARAWVSDPLVAFPMAFVVAIGVFHGRIGLTEIILDYVHSWMKDVLILISWMAAIAIIAIVFWAAITLSFVG